MRKPKHELDLRNMSFEELEAYYEAVFAELRKGLVAQTVIGNPYASEDSLEALEIEYLGEPQLGVSSCVQSIRFLENRIREGSTLQNALFALVEEGRIGGIPLDGEGH